MRKTLKRRLVALKWHFRHSQQERLISEINYYKVFVINKTAELEMNREKLARMRMELENGK